MMVTVASIGNTEETMLKPGARLVSPVDTTEVVVVHVSDAGAVVECGGVAMLPAGSAHPDVAPVADATGAVTLIGKRYGGPSSPVELLCVKPGGGPLTADGVPLPLRESKPLPASD